MFRLVLLVKFCLLLLGTASVITAASITSAIATKDINSPKGAEEVSVPKESFSSDDNNDLDTDATIYWGYKPVWRYYNGGWGGYRGNWGGGWYKGWGGRGYYGKGWTVWG